ncbi:hypothetical protein N7509_006306 [Penicillium cosmopolitanum]|uniref:Uncharacterized protein n=1 Tax=Penicillium cosmopolitanum TaxID=1131564 RepID=A0A9X0BAX8_9EURO|nr:uncharacterized protein N7509_006306 [Penicillium cosmopolitanum]KAJ5398193.1 hypothetical protein N7509_006306 [Penicillium cosmopolitanum]
MEYTSPRGAPRCAGVPNTFERATRCTSTRSKLTIASNPSLLAALTSSPETCQHIPPPISNLPGGLWFWMMRMDETADERAVLFQVLHGERIDASSTAGIPWLDMRLSPSIPPKR